MYVRRRKKNKRVRNITIFIVLCLATFIVMNKAGIINLLPDISAGIFADNDTRPGDASPSLTPAPSPSPTPVKSFIPGENIIRPSPPAALTDTKKNADGSATKSFSDGSSINYRVYRNNEIIKDYKPGYDMAFAPPEDYAEIDGVLTFRGNPARNSAAFGVHEINEKKLEIVWTHDIGVIDIWPGVGWTGQPLLVHWPEDIRNMMNITDDFKQKDLVEVIYPTLDGNIYFLDLESGKPTRPKITIGFPIKGTGVIDPRGYPLLYVGQGIDKNGKKYGQFLYRIFNLIDQKLLYSIPGKDPVAPVTTWGAFDSSGLVDRFTDTFVQCAENGLVYKLKLNTVFDRQNATITMEPDVTKYRYKNTYGSKLGIENSPVFYRNLMYFADNGGTLQCVDINTLEPLWIADVEDDTDSTMVLDETDEGVFIYTANEIDLRCQQNGKPSANCSIKKFDALNGTLIWQKDYNCIYESYINGGALATPVLGKNDIDDLIIYNIAKTGTNMDGSLIALDKKTGVEVWNRHLEYYSWSSPVDFIGSDGKTYMVLCDFNGDMHLIDPKDGSELDTVSLGRNVEGSPAIYDNMIVVGSYDLKIFGIKMK